MNARPHSPDNSPQSLFDLTGRTALITGGSRGLGKEMALAFAKAGADYLTEESRDLVPKAEQQAFFDDVDALRDRVERLAARAVRHASGPAG